jgi:DNA-binding response OmpR family regulator
MARILIVEDSSMIREFLRMLLESAGYVVEEADDGDTALQHDLKGFDLVISDIFMPRVCGFDVIRQAVVAGVPSIAVSGGDRFTGQDPLVTALDLGAALALRKPFSVPQLLQGVADTLVRRPSMPRVVEYARDQLG